MPVECQISCEKPSTYRITLKSWTALVLEVDLVFNRAAEEFQMLLKILGSVVLVLVLILI